MQSKFGTLLKDSDVASSGQRYSVATTWCKITEKAQIFFKSTSTTLLNVQSWDLIITKNDGQFQIAVLIILKYNFNYKPDSLTRGSQTDIKAPKNSSTP